MPRKKQTELQKLAKRAKALGIDLSDVNIQDAPTDTPDDKLLEAEAVLLYFDLNGKGFTHQICPTCNREFAYKYKITGATMRCSNECRRKELEERGIIWSPGRPLEDRWLKDHKRGNIPLIVPPEALEVIKDVKSENQ